jgi:malonate transporter and related proteins
MPALVFVTIAREQLATLLNWRFLAAFGGGSLIVFVIVAIGTAVLSNRRLGESVIAGSLASMTNTVFVALPILQALYGDGGVVSATIATVFVGIVMFPLAVIALEIDRHSSSDRKGTWALAKQVVLNPAVLSTTLGVLYSASGMTLPGPVTTYMGILGSALTPCALFAIGLGLSLEGLKDDLARTSLLSATKLLATPTLVLLLCLILRLGPHESVAAVICAAVPTAKTAYILAGAYQLDARVAGLVISMTTLMSLITVLGWLSFLT